MEKLLTYALKEGKLVHISKVKNGYECGCICPKCKEELSAVANIESKRYKKEAHFSHKDGSKCSGGYESALHLLAKDVFAETKELFLPDFHYDYTPSNDESFYKKGMKVSFETVILEKEISFENAIFKPDAIGTVSGKNLVVEFAITSFCNEEKRSKIRRSKISAIEIVIDPKTAILDPAYIKKLLLEDKKSKYFLFNPLLEKRYKIEQQEKLAKKKLQEEESKKREDLRIKNLIQCKKYNILQIQGKEVSLCPKNKDFFNYMKSSEYYNHPEIKNLVNGAFWNGEFYGHVNTGKFVYINGNRVTTSSMVANYEESKKQNLLYRGLMEYKRRKEILVENCSYCQFRKGKNTINGKNYITCSYLINNEPIIDVKIQ